LRAQYIRVMFDEITRILNHLLGLGAHALDIGAMTVSLRVREREDLLDCYEAVSGARMHAAYYRPGGVYRDLPDSMPQYAASRVHGAAAVRDMNSNRQGSLLDFIEDFTDRFPHYVDEYETLLTDNRIWKQRTVGIGVVSPERAMALVSPGRCCAARASSGTCARNNLRSLRPDEVRHSGGGQRRLLRPYLVRIEELRQANRIVRQCVAGCATTPAGDGRKPQGDAAVGAWR